MTANMASYISLQQGLATLKTDDRFLLLFGLVFRSIIIVDIETCFWSFGRRYYSNKSSDFACR